MQTSFRIPTAFEHYATTAYRILLDCMARPGQIRTLPDADAIVGNIPEISAGHHPNPILLASCMTLLDQETSLAMCWQGGGLAPSHELMQWVKLRTNTQLATHDACMFMICWDVTSYACISELPQGDLTFPEQGATLFIHVDEITTHQPAWDLQGPGIKDHTLLSVGSSSRQLGVHLISVRQSYPCGVDTFIIDTQGQCVGIPRSTRITLTPEG